MHQYYYSIIITHRYPYTSTSCHSRALQSSKENITLVHSDNLLITENFKCLSSYIPNITANQKWSLENQEKYLVFSWPKKLLFFRVGWPDIALSDDPFSRMKKNIYIFKLRIGDKKQRNI